MLIRKLIVMCVIPALTGGAQSVAPWRVVSEAVISGDVLPASPAFSLAPDGTLFVLDPQTNEIIRLDSAGHVISRMGRTGGGPGEFRQGHRIAASVDGGLIVFDIATNAVAYFDKDGRYLSRKSLSVGFSQVDNIVDLGKGRLALSGVVARTPDADKRAIESAIHIFGPDMALERSFGPLPLTVDTSGYTLRFWGAGYLSMATDGSLLFSRKLPYEIHRFSTSGESIKRTPVRPVERDPQDFMNRKATTTGGRSAMRFTVGKTVPSPTIAFEMPGSLLLTGLQDKPRSTIDVISESTGKLVATLPMPAGWLGVVGFDRGRSVLWALAEVNDAPVLIRQVIVF